MLLGEYECTSLIGAGTFATVLLGRQKVTNTPVAIKKIPRNNFNDPDAENRFERECNLIREMDHPFIAEFYDVIQDDKNYYIIMEYVENGNMLDYVNKNGELQEIQVRHYFCQLISVLEYLHEVKKVAHRDLKAENVLLDTHYNIRLIDFGLSNLYTDENPYLKTACGSPGMFLSQKNYNIYLTKLYMCLIQKHYDCL
ncbi:CAMK family protein kinase [Tritrichomonas foetus]|uniref:CAMK family protein kinase n=1 Tax=Tritrichomonas foetus TaxID=1144522 RepID=A0A1J4JTA8_9EUKA|nr:CAMK family protein kinase [Tritrichomonas foetus]|eukprot:OHT00758.1 CAMK family protein kinase [Tritrichomonas foetus]